MILKTMFEQSLILYAILNNTNAHISPSFNLAEKSWDDLKIDENNIFRFTLATPIS